MQQKWRHDSHSNLLYNFTLNLSFQLKLMSLTLAENNVWTQNFVSELEKHIYSYIIQWCKRNILYDFTKIIRNITVMYVDKYLGAYCCIDVSYHVIKYMFRLWYKLVSWTSTSKLCHNIIPHTRPMLWLSNTITLFSKSLVKWML